MKITFEEGNQKVVWNLPEINIRADLKKSYDEVTHNGTFACYPLEAEVDVIVKCTDKLRNALINRVKAYGTENVDPVRAILALLCKDWDGDKNFDFNQVLGDNWPEDHEQIRKKKTDDNIK